MRADDLYRSQFNMADLRLSVKHVDRLLAVLADVAANWVVFMGQLDFPPSRIRQIERDVPPGDQRSIECLRSALLQWISCNDSPTYGTIVGALKSQVVNEAVLALKVEEFSKKVKGEAFYL